MVAASPLPISFPYRESFPMLAARTVKLPP
jgi:hypothetical protein